MDLRLLERIAEAGGPAVQTCRANQATVIFKVQLEQGVTLAEESYARTVTIDSATWKPLDGHYSVSSIRAVWPEISLTRMGALRRTMASPSSLLQLQAVLRREW
ncbi:hypothetical protein [Mesorhizobium silamurunense]|uniref:hypothetical protein n=1 Tax=Mesorhizobium silamurunense TaxID=499528 RepID=UPI00177CA1E1|nr:hypothetical protein [Mesorhizobium silamurunense]